MSFIKSRFPNIHSYKLENTVFQRVFNNCDLSVIFNSTISFYKLYLYTLKTSLSGLGSIIKICKHFSKLEVLKTLGIPLS